MSKITDAAVRPNNIREPDEKGVMGTIVMALTGGAIGFMLYALYHFVREGQPPQSTRADVTVVRHRCEHDMHSKAA